MPTDRERFYYVYILGSISGTLYIGVTGTSGAEYGNTSSTFWTGSQRSTTSRGYSTLRDISTSDERLLARNN